MREAAFVEACLFSFSQKCTRFSKNLQMTRLDLSFNKFCRRGARFLSDCVGNVNELLLENCNFFDREIELLAGAIKKREQPVIL